MPKIFYAILFFFPFIIFSQNNIEKGYYINTQNTRIDGYFKIANFQDVNSKNSTALSFKEDLNEKFKTLNTFDVKEFGIGTDIKYQKVIVQVDDSNFFKDYGNEKEFITTSQNLFLNVLVEGEATLYEYQSDEGNKYFYQIKSNGKSAEQLAYKKYLVADNVYVIKENLSFREQLFNNLKCEGQVFNDFLVIKYKADELIPVFENFNKCQKNNFVTYSGKFKKKIKINLIAFAGIRYGTFDIDRPEYVTNPESKETFGFGGEVELLLPSEKWAFLLKVEYEKINTELNAYKVLSSTHTLYEHYVLDASAVNFYIGPKYYLTINNSNKLSFDACVGFSAPSGELKIYQINNTTQAEVLNDSPNTKTNTFYSFGAGYLFKKKYGMDLRYDTNRNFLPDAAGANAVITKYSRISLNLRYVIN